MNTFPGKFIISSLQDAEPQNWSSKDSGKLLKQKIKIVDVYLSYDSFSDDEANIVFTYPDNNDVLISSMENYI